MTTPLLITKLFIPPARPASVLRPRLVERLQAGLRHPLTLLSAPAGSGKTTLLSEWRAGPGAGYPVAWLSLSADDNDLPRFFQYLSAALDKLQPGLADEIQPMLQLTELPNPDTILTLLVNFLSNIKQESALVLDDYHLIELPAIHQAMVFLLDQLPPRLHLVLLTRSDPPLPIARLRARRQLIEIRSDNLRFNLEECKQFLNQIMGLNLTSEHISALEKRTEGWIAGLQLAALSMQDRDDVDGFVSAFTGSNRYIVDYLAEEVLNLQPDAIGEFLLKTSVLDRLTGSLCDALTGGSNGALILKQLEHDNLFVIPLDDEQTWFRYHHLFADLLHSRLLHGRPTILDELHSKASEWFEENGFLDEAIDHALQAKDYERAARAYSKNHLEIIYTRPISTLDKWINIFPDDYLRTDPWLCIAKAHIVWVSGNRSEIGIHVTSASNALTGWMEAGRISETDIEYQILRGDVFAFQALMALMRAQFDPALEFAQKAVQIIPKTARGVVFAMGVLYSIYQIKGDINRSAEVCRETILAARALNYSSMDANTAYSLASLLRVQGKLHQSEQVLRESLQYAEGHGQAQLFYTGLLRIGLAATYYEWNALDKMKLELETGLALCRLGGMSVMVILGMLFQASFLHAQGDLPGAYAKLEEIKRECRETDPGLYQANCLFYRLRWQARQGDYTGLDEWIGHIDLNMERNIGTERFEQLLAASEFLHALGRLDEALQILEKLEEVAREDQYLGWLLAVLVIKAVIWANTEVESDALDCLKQALEIAEPEGYVRVFLNQGESMRDLLRMLQKRKQGSEFVSRILADFQLRPPQKSTATEIQNILSKRQIELLGLIAAGYTNKEIASQLVISVATVKRHTTNIFNKLAAKNRTEAVGRARELGLL